MLTELFYECEMFTQLYNLIYKAFCIHKSLFFLFLYATHQGSIKFKILWIILH